MYLCLYVYPLFRNNMEIGARQQVTRSNPCGVSRVMSWCRAQKLSTSKKLVSISTWFVAHDTQRWVFIPSRTSWTSGPGHVGIGWLNIEIGRVRWVLEKERELPAITGNFYSFLRRRLVINQYNGMRYVDLFLAPKASWFADQLTASFTVSEHRNPRPLAWVDHRRERHRWEGLLVGWMGWTHVVTLGYMRRYM